MCATEDTRDRAVIEREMEDLRVEIGKWASPSDPTPWLRLTADLFELACRAPQASDDRRDLRRDALRACEEARARTTATTPPLPARCTRAR
jgi:hypothetical protein